MWSIFTDQGFCCSLSGMEGLSSSPFSGSTVVLTVTMATALLWLWFFRWQQRHQLSPKNWPIIGATLETLRHFDTMHDWILSYFQKGLKTFRLTLPGSIRTYTVDPANVEYILKTNFSNFPKVQMIFLICSFLVPGIEFRGRKFSR